MKEPRPHLIERAVEAMGGLDTIAPPRRAHPVPDGIETFAPLPGQEPAKPASGSPEQPPEPPPEQPLAQTSVDVVQPASAPTDTQAVPTASLPTAPLPTPVLAVPAEADKPHVGVDRLAAAGLINAPGSGRNRLTEEVSVAQHGILRAVLAGDPADWRSRVVLVTSARPGEGKSFTALNLSASLAAGGPRPVVLVDTDGKTGSLSALFGLTALPGLRRLATERKQRSMPVPVSTAVHNLTVIPYGSADGPEQPPATAVAAAVRHVAEVMPGHLVVLDTPPCLAMSDPGTLAAVAGQVVMVVEAERTQRNEVEAALDLVDSCPVLQLLLNKTRFSGSDSFGAYAYAYTAA